MTKTNGKPKKGKGKSGKQAGTGDERGENGQFQPGQSGNPAGRPKGFDFRKAVTDKAAEDGTDLEQALYDVFSSMMTEAMNGDVAAARFVADRLCGMLKQEFEMNSTTTIYLPDQARADLREMAKDKDLQAIQRAELVRRTNGTGRE